MIRPVAYYPDLLPPQSDPAGSTRYECMIMYVKLPGKIYSCNFYDMIDKDGVFAIIEHSSDYRNPIDLDYRPGVAVQDQNGTWSWWFHISDCGLGMK